MARRDDDDDAPWLAAADPRASTTVTRRSLFWTITVLLALAAVIAIGTIIVLTKRQGGSTEGYMEAEQAPLIAAEPGPYKLLPTDPQGMTVEGQDQIIYGTGAGADEMGTIDRNAVPEEPVLRPGSVPSAPNTVPEADGPPRDLLPSEAKPPVAAPATGAPVASPSAVKPAARPPLTLDIPAEAKPRAKLPDPAAAKPKAAEAQAVTKPATTKPVAKPADDAAKPKPTADATTARQTVQLGAFQSREIAEAEWAKAAPRLDGFTHTVTTTDRNGTTFYRLRASGPGSACDKLGRSGCMAVK